MKNLYICKHENEHGYCLLNDEYCPQSPCKDEEIITYAPVKQEWISVRDRLPEERDSIFARFYGTEKWKAGMFRTASGDVIACVEYEDGSRLVKVLHTISGEWRMSGIPRDGKVTHWMPLPEPPEKEK